MEEEEVMKSNFLKVNFKKVFIVFFLVSILSPLIFVLGCSGGGKGDSSPPTPTPPSTSSNRKIFVANVFGNRISVFNADDSGNVAPIRSIGSNTELFTLSGIFVDLVNHEIFVTNFDSNTITVYRRTDAGDVSPLRTIGGANTGLLGPVNIFLDTKNDEIFVVNLFFDESVDPIEVFSSITVYGRTDGGDVSPKRTIEGSNTGLSGPDGISVDPENNEIFVGNTFNNSVTVYRRTDTGNVQPIRTLSIFDSNSAGTLLDRGMLTEIYVDLANNELLVTNLNNTILVYRKTDEGEALPLRTIGANTGLLNPKWIFADTKNNEIFVSNFSSRLITTYGLTDEGNVAPLRTISQGGADQSGIFVDTERDEILVNIFSLPFAITTLRRTDKGNVTPLRSIGGINTRLFETEGLFVDTENDEIFVTNGADINIPGEITVYGRTDSGDVPPLRIISGQNTELLRPLGIFVDAKNNEIFVTNPFDDKIIIYGRTDNGNVTPIRTIEGPDTKLAIPWGIFVAESP